MVATRSKRPSRFERPARTQSARADAIASRLTNRYFREKPDPLTFDIRGDLRYWTARRCGWDVVSPAFRTADKDNRAQVLQDAREAQVWHWWCNLRYQDRMYFEKLSSGLYPRLGRWGKR